MKGALDFALATLSGLVRWLARGETRAAEHLLDAAEWLDRRRGNPRRPQGP